MRYVEAYKNGEDNGWIHKQNFWFDPEHEHGFGIVDLDSIYPREYFKHDHVQAQTVDNYCKFIAEIFKSTTGQDLTNLIEFGSAGGWFLKRFLDMGINAVGLEGTKAGIEACIKRGIPKRAIEQHDFRNPLEESKTWQVALCTEVAEHIEPPFSSVLVKSLVDSSDWIWFSFEEPNTNPAHIHHPNEMPAKFWINLFDFYGFKAWQLPEWVTGQTEGRGMYVFYNPETYDFSKLS